MGPVETRYEKLGNKMVKALEERHFEAYYCASKAEAVEKVFSLIPKQDVVGWGGSATFADLGGLTAMVKERGYAVIDRDTAKTPEERMELMRKVLTCDTFLMSANAISEDGELVNIDGFGNRVAAMIFGPKQVIVIAGMNKVAANLKAAYQRARTVAAPENAQRFPQSKTPCNATGSCADCKSPDSICSYIVTTRLSKPAKRIKVILVGEKLGF
jgi:L-lactate utilization protein LutB